MKPLKANASQNRLVTPGFPKQFGQFSEYLPPAIGNRLTVWEIAVFMFTVTAAIAVISPEILHYT